MSFLRKLFPSRGAKASAPGRRDASTAVTGREPGPEDRGVWQPHSGRELPMTNPSTISPLHQRMLEDMASRQLSKGTQIGHILAWRVLWHARGVRPVRDRCSARSTGGGHRTCQEGWRLYRGKAADRPRGNSCSAAHWQRSSFHRARPRRVTHVGLSDHARGRSRRAPPRAARVEANTMN